MSYFSAILHISKHERRKRLELGWPPVRVRNDVASVLDRTDQLDLVSRLPASMHQSKTDKGGTPAPPMSRGGTRADLCMLWEMPLGTVRPSLKASSASRMLPSHPVDTVSLLRGTRLTFHEEWLRSASAHRRGVWRER